MKNFKSKSTSDFVACIKIYLIFGTILRSQKDIIIQKESFLKFPTK